MIECINLRTRFGKVYRITFDESYDHKGVARKSLDPWMMQIPCRKGCIYPYGGKKLAVEIDYHNPTAKKVQQIPSVQMIQHGHKEQTFTFHVDLFDQVSELIHPKRRRVLSDEQRQRLTERAKQALKDYRQNKAKGAETRPDSRSDQERGI